MVGIRNTVAGLLVMYMWIGYKSTNTEVALLVLCSPYSCGFTLKTSLCGMRRVDGNKEIEFFKIGTHLFTPLYHQTVLEAYKITKQSPSRTRNYLLRPFGALVHSKLRL